MKSTVEALEDNKVKVSVTVPEDEFESELNAAFRRIAQEVRLPGFRPGKAPRKVLEARLGKGFARSEALREALPQYYRDAVREHEVDAIAAPEIDIAEGEESGQIVFDAVVEIRPQINVAGYNGLQVELPNPAVTDEEVSQQIDQLRGQFGELETVSRPAVDEDYVTIDLNSSYNGEPVAGMTTTDYVYEVGSGDVGEELDDELRGAKVGDVLELNTPHPDPSEDGLLRMRVLVKEIQEKRLPDLDDDLVQEASEFDTVEELRSDLETRLGNAKRAQASMLLRDRVALALAELVDDDIPDALVQSELEGQLRNLLLRLQAQGATFEQYLEATGRDQQAVVDELKEPATQAARIDLALRAVAETEELVVTDEEVDAEIDRLAAVTETDVDELREQFGHGDQMPAIRSDIAKRKALEWLVEHAAIVDGDGNSIDRSLLEEPGHDDDDDPDADDPDADDPDAEDEEADDDASE